MNTKVMIVSSGSRGDTQPFIALGVGLKAAGFNVQVFTNPESEKLVTDQNLKFISNDAPFKDFFGTDVCTKSFTSNNFVAFLDALGAHNKKFGPQQYTAFYKALETEKPDLVLCATQHWLDAIWIPLLFRIPAMSMNLANSHTVTPEKAPFGLPSLPFKMNRIVWKMVWNQWVGGLKQGYGKTLEDLSGKPVNDFFPTPADCMSVFGSQKVDDFDFMPYIIAQDTNFVGTKSTDLERFKFVGSMCLPADACTGEEFGGSNALLNSFLGSCPEPPVYIGWGSVTCISAKWMTLMAVRTLKLTGRKGIILKGWSNLDEQFLLGEPDSAELMAYSKDNIIFVATAAHEVLFPKCSVIVHHGGVGTTAAGVRSGRPNIITPIFYDQFESAALVGKCGQGIGTKGLPTLKPEGLAADIQRCFTDIDKIKKADEVGKAMKATDAVKVCTALIKNYVRDDIRTGKYWEGFDKFAAIKKKRDNMSFFARLGNICS